MLAESGLLQLPTDATMFIHSPGEYSPVTSQLTATFVSPRAPTPPTLSHPPDHQRSLYHSAAVVGTKSSA